MMVTYLPAVLSRNGGVATGDGDSDGFTDGRDIQGFVELLTQGTLPVGGECAYDMTGDGSVSHADVDLFVERLLGS